MKRLFSIGIAIAASMCALQAVTAAEPPYPMKPYRADFKATFHHAGGESLSMQGKIWATKTMERREMFHMGRKTINIEDRESEKTYTLIPERKMYMVSGERSKDERSPVDMIRDGDATFRRLGTDQIDGRKVVKYEVRSAGKGRESFFGHAWLTTENIPVRFTGTSTEKGMIHKIRIDYTNIVIGRQKSTLFTIPAGWQKIPTGYGQMPQAHPPGYGRRPEGLPQSGSPAPGPGMQNPLQTMTPEQIEQITRNMTPEQREKFIEMMNSFRGRQESN